MELTQRDLRFDAFRDEHVLRADWVVWSISVDDPDEAAPEDVAELTAAGVAELAGQADSVFENCVDYDTSSDDVPYYQWWIRIPQAEHAHRGSDHLPVVISRIYRLLRGMLPAALTNWEVNPDRGRTRRTAIAQLMHATYADLATALNDTFTDQYIDGGEEPTPRAKLWYEDDITMVGDFALWLAKDPSVPHQPRWLVLTAGVWPQTDADNRQIQPVTPYNLGQITSGSLDHFDLDDGRPVLLLPRPTNPIFTARVISGSFPGKGILFGRDATVEGSTYQWTARDPKALAAHARRDLDRLFPGLLTP